MRQVKQDINVIRQELDAIADVHQVKQDVDVITQELNTLSLRFNTRPESQQIDSLKEVIAQLPPQISTQVWQARQEVSGSLSQVEHQLATIQSEMVALREQLKQLQSQPSGGPTSSKPESNDDSEPSLIPSKDVIAPKVEPPRREAAQKAIVWLAAQQVNVNSYRQLNPDVDIIFNNLAVYLGERYSSLGDLHTQIKRSITTQSHCGFSLLNKSQQDILNCTQFCSKLNDYSLLSMYNYSKSKKLIQGALQRRGDVTKFLNGEWFERFVYHQVSKLLSSQRLNSECMMNPILAFPNGDRFELDLVFMIEGRPLWIECKTGNNYNTCLERYSTHRKILGVPKERAILVILGISKEQTKNLTNLWDITVANTDNFVQVVKDAINFFESQEDQQNMHSNKFNCTDNNISKTLFHTPVLSLLPSEPAILEIKGVENYAIKVLRDEPNYFDNPQNVQHFEQIVGGKAPDLKTIERLKNNLQNPLSKSAGDLNIDYKAA